MVCFKIPSSVFLYIAFTLSSTWNTLSDLSRLDLLSFQESAQMFSPLRPLLLLSFIILQLLTHPVHTIVMCLLTLSAKFLPDRDCILGLSASLVPSVHGEVQPGFVEERNE